MGILSHVAGVVARWRVRQPPPADARASIRRVRCRSPEDRERPVSRLGRPTGSRLPSNPPPPDWQSAPQQPQAPAPGGWQAAPQAPRPPTAPPPPAAPAWQSAPQQPTPPPAASWQSAPKAPQPLNVPPPPPPSWTANLTSTVPTPGPAGFVYADVPNRTIAMIIDVIAMFFVTVIVGIVAVGIFGSTGDFQNQPSTLAALASAIIGYGIWFAYFAGLWVTQRGTLGMRVLGMQIGDQADGRALTWKQGAIRFGVMFGPQIAVAILASFITGAGLLGWVGFIWLIYVLYSISSSPTKQGIHDTYAGSMVVKSARRAG